MCVNRERKLEITMKHLCIVVILMWFSASVGNGYVVPSNSEVQLKTYANNIVELYKSSGNGSSWLQMVLVFARHSSNSQPRIVIEDAPCSKSDEITDECPEVTTESTDAPIVCKQGFVLLQSKKCYFFSKKTETWQGALKHCQDMGTTLVYPMNEKENTVLVNHLKNFEGVISWWFGASDLAKEGLWVWAHSKSPIGYADWSKGEPSNGGAGEHCLHIYKAFGWKWNDVPCNNPYNYICQQ